MIQQFHSFLHALNMEFTWEHHETKEAGTTN